ncbi:hypothetical protein E5678_11685 [Hydrogenophaga sp. PAMC20947]|nr:hypothetical protein E5678_11685 [Hydrogenophaga sp. PAMC20947]
MHALQGRRHPRLFAGCGSVSTGPKAKLPGGRVWGSLKAQTKYQRQYVPKSTATIAQRQRIVAALKRAPKTSHDLRCLGVYQPSARIKELRERHGLDIRTSRVDLYDRDGYLHPRCALYTLVGTT